MTGNRERALEQTHQCRNQVQHDVGCNLDELSALPVARAVADLCQVIEDYKRENRQLRARLGEPGPAL